MVGMLWNITYSEYYLHMTYLRAKDPFERVIGVGRYIAVQRCQDPKLFTDIYR